MCLAEALLRIPDADTADRLIADKLGSADWQAHLGSSDSLFVNASTWALLLTGRIVRPAEVAEAPASFFSRLVERIGEPVVRAALRQRCGSSASIRMGIRSERAAPRRAIAELN